MALVVRTFGCRVVNCCQEALWRRERARTALSRAAVDAIPIRSAHAGATYRTAPIAAAAVPEDAAGWYCAAAQIDSPTSSRRMLETSGWAG